MENLFAGLMSGMDNSKETVQMSACFSDIISSESESIQKTDFDQKHTHTHIQPHLYYT